MATVHIDDIRRWRSKQGDDDALPGPGGMFFEIRFDSGDTAPTNPDLEYANQVLTVDSPQGVVTISFDRSGWLKSLDIS